MPAVGGFTGDLPNWIVCPECHGTLQRDADAVSCARCGARYAQRDAWLDLGPVSAWGRADPTWGDRQQEMETAYRELAADPAHTRLAYQHDFGPFAPLLADWRGRVLDVGGGNGLVRQFLPRECEYLSVDPGTGWLDAAWDEVSDTFPCLREPLAFIRGVGEHLPLSDASMDGALSFWSLNHAADPGRVIRELCRVVTPGGRALVVLDDVEPSWRDILTRAYGDERFPSRNAQLLQKVRARVVGWPRQRDHLPIAERDLRAWCRGGFAVERRVWVGRYFTLGLRRS